ncbi:uncharacterized protein LOC126981662 [Eriocheir sinensis]|uniref:uncharacterized protein LOC126981662 n=1 Tax=Eriocheir sinensis TaxID=95602 RepID=UPI0021CAA92E|nr:uncharacterized protein LOC126981662 [Eriocheir sinensis]
MAEFPCKNRQCVSLDRYCDGVRDCGDGSDEPNACSPCNRTYYGRVGSTYTLQVRKPEKGTLPHFCQLTFIASGDVYGDLVQLSIEKFSLGRFVSHTSAGCPDGYMQIEELSRPLNSGYWCGDAWGHNVFYSETSAVSLRIRVFTRLDEQPRDGPAAYLPQDSVMLRISYRFLQKERAVLRYGAPYSPKYRGEDVANTFCDRVFENCDKRNCKIQSPNFPGMYPRNLTCHYRLSQTRVPDGKVALIRVFQRNPHLIYIKDRNAPHLSREQQMRVGSACHVLHDYLVAYDGRSTRAAVLATLCKGGATLSGITSSGPHLLLVFHASPFDFPFQDSPRRRTFGFELDVEVEFVDRASTAYVRPGEACSHEVSSRGQRSGYLQAPAHSLLPNTTCWWRLLAEPSEVVWLYFLHYRHVHHPEMPTPAHCSNTLTITDGDVITAPPPQLTPLIAAAADNTSLTTTLLGRFCRPDKLPRVCSGVHAPGPHAAPCLPGESYVSSSPALTLSLRYAAGTAPAHVEFLARYEFVDKRQWGVPTPGGGPCDRTFTLRPEGLFASPRDVFLFGRGGSRKLRCVYTFQAAPHQRVALRIIRSRMGSACSTEYRHASLRFECSHGGAAGRPAIWVQEQPWPDVAMTRACVCATPRERPFSVLSYTPRLQLVFSVPAMTAQHDYTHFFFEGEYSIVDAAPQGAECDFAARRLEGRFGNFTVGGAAAEETEFEGGGGDPCLALPRLVTATDGSFLFLRLPGTAATQSSAACPADWRLNVYAPGGLAPLASVCPAPRYSYTPVFSSGWRGGGGGGGSGERHHVGRRQQETRDLLLEVAGNASVALRVSWVSVWRPLQTAPLSPAGADLCPHRCPEISACLPPQLWCDGEAHCPDGTDEGAAACGLLAALPWVYLAAGTVLMGSLAALLAAVVVHRRRSQAVKAVAAAVVENNSHGLKSATHDPLLPPEKDSW